ncbi:hypothetical protein [Arthrobacter sp. UYEF21]|uniref:hypothetical protein n=1 Tax=Arthrobacter sp. UYEF21 TaxID=1756364 RepID=UPI003395282B
MAVEVYSTGCIIDVKWILRRTDQEDRKWAEINAVSHRPAPQVRDGGISSDSILLLGVQFPDGTKASSSSLAMYGHKPLDQKPDGPVFEYRPKGGNGGEDDMSANAALWLWPLPPAGDLRLVAQWTDMGMPESSISLDGLQLRDAAAGVQKYWPEGRRAGMNPLNNPVLLVVFAAVFFYVLYGVIRAAVRDGILQADERREKARSGLNSGERGSAPGGGSSPGAGTATIIFVLPYVPAVFSLAPNGTAILTLVVLLWTGSWLLGRGRTCKRQG